MSENRGLLQRFTNAIVKKLTGQDPARQQRRRKIVVVKPEENTADVSAVNIPAQKRKRKKKPGLQHRLQDAFKLTRIKASKAKVDAAELTEKIRLAQKTGQGIEPPITTEISIIPVAPQILKKRRHRGRRRNLIKNSEFYKKLFRKQKKRRRKPLVIPKAPKSELFYVLPGELHIMANSAGLFILAYLSIYLIYQFTEILVASAFGIDSVLYYYEIYFPIGNNSELWTRFNIIAITLASPFAAVLTSLLIYQLILKRQKINPQFRLFFMWMAFLGSAHFLGAFVAGIVTSQGFGYVANWLFLNTFIRISFSLIFLFLLTVIGYRSAGYAIETIPQGIRKEPWRKFLAIGSRFVAPWILGSILVAVVKIPNAPPQHPTIMVYDLIILATAGFLVTPLLFNQKARARNLAERPSRRRQPPALVVLGVAFFVLILFRLFLYRGLHLAMHFNLNVGFYN